MPADLSEGWPQDLVSCPVCLLFLGMTSFSWSESLMYLSFTDYTDLGWLSRAIGMRMNNIHFAFLPSISPVSFRMLAMNGVCGLLADSQFCCINQLRLRFRCCWLYCWPVVSSSLWKPWSLLLSCNKENCAWNLWDRGTRCFSCGLLSNA
jgi:hypothetical protein